MDGGGRGQPGGWRVPDTRGKCAWFWKSEGFTMLTTLIVFEVGRTCAEFAQSGVACRSGPGGVGVRGGAGVGGGAAAL